MDQPKISALVNGRLAGFSSDRLLRFLTALGVDVELTIRQREEGVGAGRLRVVDSIDVAR